MEKRKLTPDELEEKRKKKVAAKKLKAADLRRQQRERAKELAELAKLPIEERHLGALVKLERNEDIQFKKRGRKTLFRARMIDEGRRLAGYGLTNPEIAIFWGVSEKSLDRWIKRHPEFSRAIKKGKQQADLTVAESLYKRANGYDYTERKYKFYNLPVDPAKPDGEHTQVKTLVEESVKHIHADSTAIIFWLKNRQPEKWRDRQDLEFPGITDPETNRLLLEIVHTNGDGGPAKPDLELEKSIKEEL